MSRKSTLFIVSAPYSRQTLLGDKVTEGDALLLRGDACYNAQQFCQYGVPVFALHLDVTARGATEKAQGVTLIDDKQWVELTLEYARLISE